MAPPGLTEGKPLPLAAAKEDGHHPGIAPILARGLLLSNVGHQARRPLKERVIMSMQRLLTILTIASIVRQLKLN